MLGAPDGRLQIEQQSQAHHVAPTWPSQAGDPMMMVHVDIGVSDLDAALRWAIGQGAARGLPNPSPAFG